jgi:hypothetical protein
MADHPTERRIVPASFPSPLHDERVGALLGAALGVTFTVCFATGLLSHFWQDQPGWFPFPARPAGLYRVTQGLHVTTGLMSIPLLLAKLWSVFPKLFTWPPFATVGQLLVRLALLPLIGGSLLLLFTGLANVNIYRPWPFDFRAGHYWAAWLVIGGLVVHVAANWATTRRHVRLGPPPADPAAGPELAAGLSRRGFVGTVLASSLGVALLTVGQTFRPLERLALLSPRRPSVGPQGLPVNRTAASAGVTREQGADPDFRLRVDGPGAPTPRSFSLDELRALPQRAARLPIACVEGWSAEAGWRGVPVRDLLSLVGASEDAEVTVMSFQRGRRLGSSELNRHHAHDPDTLLAMELDGEPLHLEHGYPLRLIGPNRPGVLQTKWIDRLVVR